MLYYILCHERIQNGTACWWRPNHNGYTNNLNDAGLYPLEEAREICNNANRHGAMAEEMIPEHIAVGAAWRTVDLHRLREHLENS